ncbi:hypothetical protein GCM10023340_02910 [Nocardioides marinquilinus]|uniref:DUF4097 domain-containing protein n=1 Tax=Nocardioides marinquilinus TaxID=1210400 RepID=A0ABP9P6V5_9ACTN
MADHAEHHFETHQPVELYVESGKGDVEITAAETTETTVEISGTDADDVVVDLAGSRLTVIAPKHRNLLGGDRSLDISVRLPLRSDVETKLGSADLRVDGLVGNLRARSGSGEVTLQHVGGACLVETGSGDTEIERVDGSLRVKSGSGDVEVGHAGAEVTVSTGSGDVALGETGGPTAVKTGSGDLKVGTARTDVGLSTGSGDLEIGSVSAGRVQVKGASGDVRVGVPAGVPVWTDVSTVSGRIHSTLEGAGKPEPGADYVELRVKTVSGDVDLAQV